MSVAGISRHLALSEDSIRQCRTSSGSCHKDTDQCLYCLYYLLALTVCWLLVHALYRHFSCDFIFSFHDIRKKSQCDSSEKTSETFTEWVTKIKLESLSGLQLTCLWQCQSLRYRSDFSFSQSVLFRCFIYSTNSLNFISAFGCE